MNNFYPYNNFQQYPYGYQSNMQRQGQMANMQPPQSQPMPMQQQAQPQQPIQYDMPINYIGYANLKEAEAHILFPNQKAIFIDKANGMVYEKVSGIDGQSFITHFKRVEPQSQEMPLETTKEENSIDLSSYVKKSDLDTLQLATMEDLKNIPLVSRQEYEELSKKVDKLLNATKIPQITGVKPNVTTIKQSN